MFVIRVVEYVKEATGKKPCKYGEYGTFEHSLFLLTDRLYNLLPSLLSAKFTS